MLLMIFQSYSTWNFKRSEQNISGQAKYFIWLEHQETYKSGFLSMDANQFICNLMSKFKFLLLRDFRWDKLLQTPSADHPIW